MIEFIYAIFIIANMGNVSETPIISPLPAVQQVAYAEEKTDTRESELRAFFERFNSPFVGLEKDFIESADKYGLDWKLLPVVTCVESSCGKYCKLNCMGWGSGKIDFGTHSQDIDGIASKIATLHYYKTYLKTQDLYDFAKAYNSPFAEDYRGKLEWFYNKL